MKSKVFVQKLLVVAVVSVLAFGCKSDKAKQKGANKSDIVNVLDAYSKENEILKAENDRKDKEIEMLKAELTSLQQQSMIDNETINRIKNLVAQSGGDFTVTSEGVVLESDVTFASGSEILSARGQANVKKLLETGYLKEGTIYVIGHTDSDPIVRTKAKHSSNFELSAKRAAHVAELLHSLGVAGERIVIQAHGEFKPLPGKSKKEQRRIVFRVAK